MWDFLTQAPDELEQYVQTKFNEQQMKKAKKVKVEKGAKHQKMIVYREQKDGGIQGILMDFYID